MGSIHTWLAAFVVLGATTHACAGDQPLAILDLAEAGANTARIDFKSLPTLAGEHAVISHEAASEKFQLHSYLIHHDGLYWCMWSQGPPTEDEPSQQVRYATSVDGLHWTKSRTLTGPPDGAFAYIARGFWLRDGKLHALVASFRGKGAFGSNKLLELRAWAWDRNAGKWESAGLVHADAINNFPPERLASGEWMMTRRDAAANVSMLVGGVSGLGDWHDVPLVGRGDVRGFVPDEPIWWARSDGRLVTLLRDNGGSSRLFMSQSGDGGASWSIPEATNFPNIKSKVFSLPVATRCRALLSNSNAAVGRLEMHLSTSADGERFTRMARLGIPSRRPATLQYPHAIVHDGHLLIAFSRNKTTIEVFRAPLAEILAMCS